MNSRTKWIAILAVTCSTQAYAQTTQAEREATRALMDEGDAKLAERKPTEALKAYLAADEIAHAPTTSLAVGRALEENGKLLEALERYVTVQRSVPVPSEPKVYAAARAEAAIRHEALAVAIPSVHLLRAEGLANVTVTVDDVELPAAALSQPKRLNPGRHVFKASLSGFKPFSASVELIRGDTKTVRIVLLPEGTEPAASPSATTASAPPAKPEIPRVNPTPAKTVGYPLWGWIGAGVGVVGIASGAVFGTMALSDASDAKAFCNDQNVCKPDAQPFIDSSNNKALASTLGFGVGIVGAGIAVAAILLHPKSSPEARSKVIPFAGLGHAGIGGSF